MLRPIALASLALVGLAAPLSLADAVQTRGAISEVTVYRGQALITRSIAINQPQGLAEIIITDLPDHTIADSLFAESGNAGGLEVRSIRFRNRPVMEDVNEEVRALDDKIAELTDRLAAGKRHEQVLTEHKGYLAKLEQFVAPTATTELTSGVLNAETLASLTQMLYTQRRQLAEDELKLAAEQKALGKQIEQAKRERATITSGSARTVREAVVLVEVRQPRNAELRVKYLVNNANWTPSYTARAGGDGKSVTLEYYASIQQMTGEDWTGVAMTLSTATPSLAARAPQLTPMNISLAMAHQAQAPAAQTPEAYSSAKMQNFQLRAQVEQQRGMGGGRGEFGARARFDDSLNELADKDLMLDLTGPGEIRRASMAKLGAPMETESLSVTYVLSGATSLPSRSDRQQVQIASNIMPAEFYKIATPILTSAVYDEAQAVNSSTIVLLAGPVAAYVQGRFVGNGALPTVSIGESFTLGFGIDSSLKARRELVERSQQIQGGNRLIDLTYRIAIDNFDSKPAMIRVLERIPKTQDQQIKLTLTGLTPELSQSAITQATKEGTLRWDVTVPAQSFGPKAQPIEYRLRLEHDKQLAIAGLPGQ
jgi:hypothetical protein